MPFLSYHSSSVHISEKFETVMEGEADDTGSIGLSFPLNDSIDTEDIDSDINMNDSIHTEDTGIIDINPNDNTDTDENSGNSLGSWEKVIFSRIAICDKKFDRIRERVTAIFQLDLRPWQASAIHDLTSGGKDVIVIAGTGSGKSLVYQSLPAVISGGIVLVVSPTVALMDDQVRSLVQTGLKAVALTANAVHERPTLWQDIDDGKFDVILASPEILLRDGSHFFLVTVRNRRNAFCRRLRLLAIDEAHLVWGWREFRKEYLNVGAIRLHFPKVPIVALSATLAPNVAEYISSVLYMRKTETRLYKLSVDRPNITQFVAIAKRISDYAVLSEILIPASGALWMIPKAMVFVDSIDRAHGIVESLQKSLYCRGFAVLEAELVVRPFSANLEQMTRKAFMEFFRMGNTRVLVCTDAAGMGIDVSDVQIVMQWGLSKHLTLAALWQRIGRAGRGVGMRAVSVVFAEQRHILPEDTSGGDFAGFTQPVVPYNAESRQAVRSLIRGLYRNLNPITLPVAAESLQAGTDSSGSCTKGRSAYHEIDPALLFYVNTIGCRCRAVMAAFVDATAYSGTRNADCCDNILYSESGSDKVPEWQRHRVNARHSLRFLSTRQYLQENVHAEVSRDIAMTARRQLQRETKGRPVPEVVEAVDNALDAFIRHHFPRTYDSILPRAVREKVAAACYQISTERDLARTLLPRIEMSKAAFAHLASEMLLTVTTTAAAPPPIPVRSVRDNPDQSTQASSSCPIPIIRDNPDQPTQATSSCPIPIICDNSNPSPRAQKLPKRTLTPVPNGIPKSKRGRKPDPPEVKAAKAKQRAEAAVKKAKARTEAMRKKAAESQI